MVDINETAKLRCGAYDYDEVFVPGTRLIDEQIIKNGKKRGLEIVLKATTKYEEELFDKQTKLMQKKQELERDRDILCTTYFDIINEINNISILLDEHFKLKDAVLEETRKEYENLVDYDEIYQKENIYPGVCELLWEIYELSIYEKLFNNSNYNMERESKAKRHLLETDFPPMKFVPVPFYVFPAKDPNGFPFKDRPRSDKVLRMCKNNRCIDPASSTYVDNSKRIIEFADACGFKSFFVKKDQDPRIAIIEAANYTIDRFHEGKIKKLSLH